MPVTCTHENSQIKAADKAQAPTAYPSATAVDATALICVLPLITKTGLSDFPEE